MNSIFLRIGKLSTPAPFLSNYRQVGNLTNCVVSILMSVNLSDRKYDLPLTTELGPVLFRGPVKAIIMLLLISDISFAGPIQLSNDPNMRSTYSMSGDKVVWTEFQNNLETFPYASEIFLFDGTNILQLTEDDQRDFNPSIDGNYVVWQKTDNPWNMHEHDIYLYDGTETIQITDDSADDQYPLVSDGNIAWLKEEGLAYYDGKSTTVLSARVFWSWTQRENFDIAGKKVVWSESVSGNSEIFMYDGSTTIQLTDNSYDDSLPRIHDDRIVWLGNNEIFLYENSSTIQLTFDGLDKNGPEVGKNFIAWSALNSSSFADVFIYDGSTTVQLDNAYGVTTINFSISDNGIIWDGYEEVWDNSSVAPGVPPPFPSVLSNIYFSDGKNIYRLTNNVRYGGNFDGRPIISGNNIAWLTALSGPARIQLNYHNLSGPKAKQVWISNGPNSWDAKASKQVVGDYNGDGKDDVAVMYDYKASREARLFVFLANDSGGFNDPVQWWASGQGNFDASGATLTSGDYNGDGKDDIAALYGFSVQRDVKAFVFKSSGSSFSINEWWHAGAGNWDADGSKLVSGDFDGDNKDDMAIFYGYQNERDVRIFVFLSNGTSFAGSATWWHAGAGNWDWAGSKILADDFDGDNKTDIAVFYGYETERDVTAFVFLSTGAKFPASIPWWSAGPNNWDHYSSKLVSGDYDGDGIADMAVMYGYGGNRTAIFTFPTGVNSFSNSNVYYDSGPENWPWDATEILSGDFDGNGTDQFAAFFDFERAYSGLFLFE